MATKTASLIIPIYNVRNYLRKCLDSVAAQTYSNLEVLIINDGSPDDSLEIALEYTSKYPHFHCYTIENRGLGGARNYGMEQAKGDYILFLDGDDYLTPNCVEVLVAAAEENGSDIVAANCYDVWEDGSLVMAYKNIYQKANTSLAQEPQLLFNRICACFKLFRRELLEGFSFVSRMWYEDLRLIPKLYLHAKTITYVDDSLYYYVQREGSIMNNSGCSRNLEIVDAFEDLLDYYRQQGMYERYRAELEFLVIEHIAVSGIGRAVFGTGKEKRDSIRKMQAYLETFDHLYDNPYLKTQARNRKIVLWCNRCGWYWATKLLLQAKQAIKKEKKR